MGWGSYIELDPQIKKSVNKKAQLLLLKLLIVCYCIINSGHMYLFKLSVQYIYSTSIAEIEHGLGFSPIGMHILHICRLKQSWISKFALQYHFFWSNIQNQTHEKNGYTYNHFIYSIFPNCTCFMFHVIFFLLFTSASFSNLLLQGWPPAAILIMTLCTVHTCV